MGFMSHYQVIARKFRPQNFSDVIGQEAIVTTLQNAVRYQKLAHAYLFCGPRGTGKTTLARILAKAANCERLEEGIEPCNVCPSCVSILNGSSIDVIEIDGASNRGIDDIRKINETAIYSSAGRYKIYIIDEVHMLTKDAFNALLKTLEEPPPHVKFFFATTEAHKVIPTIVSRCQKFQLKRIPAAKIKTKLVSITKELGIHAEEEALDLIAERAEGGLRDAESLLDQIIAFEANPLTAKSVEEVLGIAPRALYFEIDLAGEKGNFIRAFEIADQLFTEGKDFVYFIEGLIQHLRQILLLQLDGTENKQASDSLKHSCTLYTKEQCLDLIDYLIKAQESLRFSGFSRLHLEAILLHVMRSHFEIPIEALVYRLEELEKAPPLENQNKKIQERPKEEIFSPAKQEPILPSNAQKSPLNTTLKSFGSINEDPSPSDSDLGKSLPKSKKVETVPIQKQECETPSKPAHHYDTLYQFASIELEGKIQKN